MKMLPTIIWLPLLFMGATVQAGQIRIANVIPGAGIITKKMKSMQELRYADLIRQQTDFSCGAAALATILHYGYQQDVTENDVLAGMIAISDSEVVKKKGFSLLDMKRYVSSIGMRGRGYRVGMKGVGHLKVPTIILLDMNGYEHFVVLKKVDGNKVYLADPALGNRVITLEELDRIWKKSDSRKPRLAFAVIGRGFDRQTVLLTPAGIPTVRRFQLSAPLTDADLLEFGFSHADLF